MTALLFLSALTSNALINASSGIIAEFSISGIDSMISSLKDCSFTLIIAIFTALFVCNDYEQQTIKNIYSIGYSRKSVYLSKMTALWIAISIMFIVVETAGFTLGSIFFGVGSIDNTNIAEIVLIQYVVILANAALFYAITSILHKNGSSIAACIVAPMIINVILNLADSFLKIKEIALTDFWLSSFLSDISTRVPNTERLIVCLIASLIYTIIFLLIGYRLSGKKNSYLCAIASNLL